MTAPPVRIAAWPGRRPAARARWRWRWPSAGASAVEIVSVDSALVYRGMDIGTAKPSAAERAAVPHHLIDILDPRERLLGGAVRRRRARG